WLGFGFKGGATHFVSPYDDIATAGDHKRGMIRVSGVHWFTNLDHNKRHEEIILFKEYNPLENPIYEDVNAINIKATSDIPCNYDGIMGVPITFMDKYSPDQFEILDCMEPCIDLEKYRQTSYFKSLPSRQLRKNGKLCQKTYHRLLIRKKK
ncbi:MAG: modification methylase, partial [Muribaculaceae bacterium]|nr:modification methylase [Muribaculaceae bacterium]